MDPLLATGLVSLGHRVANQLMDKVLPSTNTGNLAKQSFDQLLRAQNVSPNSTVGQLLQAEGVSGSQDFKELQYRVEQQLFNHPEMANFIQGQDRNGSFELTLRDGNLFTLTGENGKSISFTLSSELGQLAEQASQLASLQQFESSYPQAYTTGHLPQTGLADATEQRWTLGGGLAY